MTCITGLTAQNTLGVKGVYPVKDQTFINEALEAVNSDVGIDAIKTGMLTSKETIETVVKFIENIKNGSFYSEKKPLFLVVDPVMVSTSGHNLISSDAIDNYVNKLIPLATVFTPNIIETESVLKQLGKSEKVKVESLEDMKNAAKTLHSALKCQNVLVKGGHLPLYKKKSSGVLELSTSPMAETGNEGDRIIIDVLYDGKEMIEFQSQYIDSKSTHGTGCTLSSAIAANLAKGKPIKKAIQDAVHYVQTAIQTSYPIGKGNGPVNHMHNIQHRPFAAGKFLDYLLSHPKVQPHWQRYINHEFTKKVGNNTLPLESFKYFLRQDYLYLKHYARCYGLSIYKSDDMETIKNASSVIIHIAEENKLHIDFCAKFGISVEELESGVESLTTYAYSRYLVDVGAKEDWLSLHVAMSPCLFGYGQAANILVNEENSIKDINANPYWSWVENYTNEGYQDAIRAGRELLETNVLKHSADRIEELVDIFATTTQMECRFWDAALAYTQEEN